MANMHICVELWSTISAYKGFFKGGNVRRLKMNPTEIPDATLPLFPFFRFFYWLSIG
jgi:hypothetical protein